MNIIKTLMILLSLGLTVACSQDGQFNDIRNKMEAIKQRPKGHIEPPPEFKAYKSFTYSAAASRSPFSPPIDIELTDLPKGRTGVKPNFDRTKEVLEGFSLDALLMVGTLMKPGGQLYALIKAPDGGLHRVAQGNHMGRNFGTVLAVNSLKVDVMEIVSDGQDGWIERPRTIVITE
ncbi:pilus assembly protein PilP [Gammaproteobacteria bacterium 45_16_T64]|nr:pilus assembly protein PilP [Gammaproteobacteria bacterium 45_16_T64]